MGIILSVFSTIDVVSPAVRLTTIVVRAMLTSHGEALMSGQDLVGMD